ncbi:F0F1 ATP synthase subunit delta [Piscinibacter sakaiensis]|uniref:ATP synthase subunit delta n=1 Tax=Piscinibacter sakaiensis TaxID=1547922 RepID=A0A0K8P091_PISS1|nr:F0F1 ATP synthase subunit delta [Piscinibacter sakaiensis]GAP36051.1 ATP synthase, delta chain [Piscinibacter sakaiensis]
MAELATIARPYAEAFHQVARQGDLAAAGDQLDAVAAVAGDAQLRQLADNPNTTDEQVLEVITAVVKRPLTPAVVNLLRTMVANGRLAALPEVAVQVRSLANAESGVADAVIHSAYPIEGAQLAEVVAALEKRFGRRLSARVELEPELIGGIRVVVGDEVLDTSVKARLEQMKQALTA